MDLTARIVTLRLAETFVIARESADEAEVVQVEVRHGDVSGFGEAAPIERYGESAASALAWLDDARPRQRSVGARPDPRLAAAGRVRRAGGGRRGAPRSAGQARRRAGVPAARAAPRRPADVLDGLARRPGRHGAARRGCGGARVPAAEAEGRRRATGSTSSASRPSAPSRRCRCRSTSTSTGRSTRRSSICRNSTSSTASSRCPRAIRAARS